MNIKQIALECGITVGDFGNQWLVSNEQLTAFANALIGDSEPVAYMWQHEETGNVGFTDQYQIDNGFEKNNPRLNIVAPLYTKPPKREDK